MDFLDPVKKRAHTIRLYIGYVLVAIAIVLGAVILLFAAYGYGIDRQGNVFQNGLVFVSSIPDAAEVNIKNTNNGHTQQILTNNRINLPSGQYQFELLKQGYRPWQRTIDLRGGALERLVYPFLFPESLVTKDIRAYAGKPAFSAISPNRETILVQRTNSGRSFDVYDTRNIDATPRVLTLPADMLTSAKTQTYKLVEWSGNSRYVLVERDMGATSEFLLIDVRLPDRSINLNDHFGVMPKTATLRDRDPDHVYLLQNNGRLLNGDVRRAQSSLLLQNVVTYKSYGEETLVYVSSEPTSKGKASVLVRSKSQSYKIRELPKAPRYLLDISRYNEHWHIVVGSANDEHMYIYRDPVEALRSNDPERVVSVRSMPIKHPDYVSFSANSQFIATQADQQFVVYDILADRQYRFQIKTPFDTNNASTWMDGHRLLNSSKGKIVVIDFDGSNYQVLNPTTPGALPMFDGKYTNLYVLAPSDTKGRTALTRTELYATDWFSAR